LNLQCALGDKILADKILLGEDKFMLLAVIRIFQGSDDVVVSEDQAVAVAGGCQAPRVIPVFAGTAGTIQFYIYVNHVRFVLEDLFQDLRLSWDEDGVRVCFDAQAKGFEDHLAVCGLVSHCLPPELGINI